MSADHRKVLARLDRYAILLDAQFQVPGTRIRFGLDPIFGLLPVVGDAMGFLMSLYILVEAVRLDVSRNVLFVMVRNVGFEALFGVIPVFGDIFDIGYKANLRNVRLLRDHLEERRRPVAIIRSRRWIRWLFLMLFAGLAVGMLVVLSGVIRNLSH